MSTRRKGYCNPEVSPKCPGHEGWERFSTCLVEALFMMPDAETGEVDAPTGWAGLVVQDEAQAIESNRDLPVTIPAGTYMVIRTNDQGRVWTHVYLTAEEAQACFDEIESAYGDWCHGSDVREYAITSSTGRTGS